MQEIRSALDFIAGVSVNIDKNPNPKQWAAIFAKLEEVRALLASMPATPMPRARGAEAPVGAGGLAPAGDDDETTPLNAGEGLPVCPPKGKIPRSKARWVELCHAKVIDLGMDAESAKEAIAELAELYDRDIHPYEVAETFVGQWGVPAAA